LRLFNTRCSVCKLYCFWYFVHAFKNMMFYFNSRLYNDVLKILRIIQSYNYVVKCRQIWLCDFYHIIEYLAQMNILLFFTLCFKTWRLFHIKNSLSLKWSFDMVVHWQYNCDLKKRLWRHFFSRKKINVIRCCFAQTCAWSIT